MLSLLVAFALQGPKKVDPFVFYNPGATAPPWTGQGGIKSDDYKVEHRDKNGNVEGTEFVHLEYNVSTREVDLPPDCWYYDVIVTCDRICNDKKHKNHSECDLSCDDQCQVNHHFTLRGDYDELRDNMNKMTADSAALARKGVGEADPPDWSSEVSHALKDAERAVKKEVVDMTPAHLTSPCTLDDRYYGYKPKQFQVHADMHKVGFYMTRGQKTPIDELVGTQDGVVALLYYPSKDVLFESSAVACKCEKKVVIPEIPPYIPWDGFWPTDDGIGWTGPDGGPVIPDDDKVHVTAHGIDLNEAEIDIDNESGQDLKCILLPGLLLLADDLTYQAMVILDTLSAMCAANTHTSIVVSLDRDGNYSPTVMKPRVACTEISKHEPSTATKMHISPSKNDHLRSLCRMYAKDRLHFGGLDQARAWICLSHSTMDEINKIMFPKVSEGTYLNALKDVAATGVDVEAKEYRPCIDITLLEGSTSRTNAVKWFVRFWEGHDLTSMTSYAGRMVDHETQALAGGQAIELRHAADVALAFLTSTEPAIRDAGLRILSQAVPEANRVTVIQNGGLKGVWNSLASGDDAEIVKALAVIDLYQDKTYLGQVAGLSSYSQNANVKMTAQALKVKLKG